MNVNIKANFEPLTSGMSAKLNPVERMRGIKAPISYSVIWEQLENRIRNELPSPRDTTTIGTIRGK